MKNRVTKALLLAIIFIIGLAGCIKEENKNNTNLFTITTIEENTKIIVKENVAAAEFVINGEISQDIIKAGPNSLRIVRYANGNTLVAVAAVKDEAQKGEIFLEVGKRADIAVVNSIKSLEEIDVKGTKRIGETLLGDINGSGAVDVQDFSKFVAGYGKSTGDTGFEANADIYPSTKGAAGTEWADIYCVKGTLNGSVDLFDFKVFSYNYGKSIGKTVSAVNVTGTAVIGKDTSTKLTAVVAYSDGTTDDTGAGVVWKSSNTGVVQVTDGVIKGISAGSAEISAEKGGKTGVIAVTVTADEGITIYVEKPDAWQEIWIWYTTDGKTVWDTATLKAPPGDLTNYRTGWYKKVLPVAVKSVEFLFNDGTWNNKMCATGYNQATTAPNFKTTKTVWISKNYKVTEIDPVGPQPAQVSAAPGIAGGEFSISGDITVTLGVIGDSVTKSVYTDDGTDPKTSGTAKAYTNGTEVTFGASMAVNDKKTIRVYAVNNLGEETKTYTYVKKESVANANNLRIYQVMVESFQDGSSSYDYNTGYGPSNHKGDLRGIINALPYIKGLGCNALWMTPIFKSGGTSQLDATGYFCKDYFQIDPKFGTLADAKELVQKAHEMGMYVFLDGVFGHHGGSVAASPSGKYPTGGNNPVSYPGSLDFYKEVATYWIDTLEIDGWRLDQAYQVSTKNQDRNYWKDIREAVEAKCAERKNAGKTWGTLGYMVGEIWDGETNIQKWGYDASGAIGLKSCFDFPVRYSLVTVLATKEHTDEPNYKGQPASSLNNAMNSKKTAYSSWAQPNFMLTNHDLVRFGDLIQRAGYGGKENIDYWKRHKAAFAFMSAYTGPVTIYYGDEIGDEVPGVVGMNSGGYYDDNVSRSNGQISGLDSNQQDLYNYVSKLMTIRDSHPALWNGDRVNLIGSDANIYADLKTSGSDKVVFVMNAGTASKTAVISQSAAGGTVLKNLMDNTTITASGGNYNITLDGLTGGLYQVQ